MRTRPNRFQPFAAGLLMSLALVACSAPSDPWDVPVEAHTGADWDRWQYRHSRDLGPRGERELAEATRQLFLALQIEQAGLPPDSLKAQLRERIDGRTTRALVTEALLIERARLHRDQFIDTALLERNREIAVHPISGPDVVDAMTEKMREIRNRQQVRSQRIGEIETRLVELNPGRTPESLEVERSRKRQTKSSIAL
jgi:hypothetical protein